jgi:hypothetical protein
MIRTVPVLPVEDQDIRSALDLLRRTRFRWKPRLLRAKGETIYGTVENLVAS